MATLSTYDELLLEIKPQPIRTPAQYRRALKQLDLLMEPHPSRERAMMIDVLASLVQNYEATQGPAPRKLSPAERLRELLEARELSQADVSRAAEVPRTILSNVLAGRRDVSKANAIRLARYFRVPLEDFIDGREVKPGKLKRRTPSKPRRRSD
jgi:HTH-type transcriptional regulator/antitoxin HigA